MSRSPSPLTSPPRRGNSRPEAPECRKSPRRPLRTGCAERGTDEWRNGSIAHQRSEQFSLYSGERAGVRASVALTFC